MNYQPEFVEKYRRDILYKFNLTFVIVFTIGFIFFAHTYLENEKNEEWVKNSNIAKDNVTLYFDSLITLMLTGKMEYKEVLRKKTLSRPNVLDARLIRNSAHFEIITPDQEPLDDLDKRALKSADNSIVRVNENTRVLSVVVPMHATENTRGVNCLICHNVESGEVMGVIRIDYSLVESDRNTEKNYFNNIGFLLLIFIAALLVANLVVTRSTKLKNRLDGVRLD